jgi:hypothetical protein
MKACTMNPLHRQAGVLAATFVFGIGPGCAAPASGDSSPASQSKRAQVARSGADGWMLAPAKAGGSGVSLRYAVPRAISAGETVLVRLQLADVVADGAQVEVRPGDPSLQLLPDGAGPGGPITLVRGETRELELQVAARADGLHFLNVFTRQNGRTSAASVPLRVGEVRSKPQRSQVQTTPAGEKVISLPSQ